MLDDLQRVKQRLFFRLEVFTFPFTHTRTPTALVQQHKIIEECGVQTNIVILFHTAVLSVELHNLVRAINMPIGDHAVTHATISA